MTDLGVFDGTSSYALGINNSGQIAGYTFTSSGNLHAFLYSSGSPTYLGDLGGGSSLAEGLNDLGQVVGYSETSTGCNHAFLYSGGSMSDLGTLGGLYVNSLALSINTSSQIVGYSYVSSSNSDHGFLYTSGVGMQDLNILYGSLLVGGTDSQAGFTNLDVATAINSSGQICWLW